MRRCPMGDGRYLCPACTSMSMEAAPICPTTHWQQLARAPGRRLPNAIMCNLVSMHDVQPCRQPTRQGTHDSRLPHALCLDCVLSRHCIRLVTEKELAQATSYWSCAQDSLAAPVVSAFRQPICPTVPPQTPPPHTYTRPCPTYNCMLRQLYVPTPRIQTSEK